MVCVDPAMCSVDDDSTGVYVGWVRSMCVGVRGGGLEEYFFAVIICVVDFELLWISFKIQYICFIIISLNAFECSEVRFPFSFF